MDWFLDRFLRRILYSPVVRIITSVRVVLYTIRALSTLLLLSVIFLFSCKEYSGTEAPRNIILCVGDGMGYEQIKAGSLFCSGKEEGLSFQSFPIQGELKTASADHEVTDSAAAATAMATGHKVANGVLSVAIPGDGHSLETILERFARQGKGTGLVTTTTITHATPAAFAAHVLTRTDTSRIAEQMISHSRPNVLFGGGGEGMSRSLAEEAGYLVVTNRAELEKVSWTIPFNGWAAANSMFISGQFGLGHLPYEMDGLEDLPSLSEMTQKALELLENISTGFFLMVEGGRIDHAAHANDIERLVREVAQFDRAVEEVVRWAQGRYDTLILVTADHETGGLQVVLSRGKGVAPQVSWTTSGHTAANVPLYAKGVSTEKFQGLHENTEIHDILVSFDK